MYSISTNFQWQTPSDTAILPGGFLTVHAQEQLRDSKALSVGLIRFKSPKFVTSSFAYLAASSQPPCYAMDCCCGLQDSNSFSQPSSIQQECTPHKPNTSATKQSRRMKTKYRSVKSRQLNVLLTEIEELVSLWNSGSLQKEDERLAHFQLLPLLKDGAKLRALAERLVDAHEPFGACHILQLAHHLECKFKANVYEAVAYRLAETEQWIALPFLVRLRREQTGGLTVRLLNWLARAYVETNQFAKLDSILNRFEKAGLQPTRRTHHLLVSGHIRNRDLPRAKECLSMMEQTGIPIDPSTHALIVTVYRSLGLDGSVRDHALASLPRLEARTGTIVLNSLIQMCLDVRDVDSAWGYLSMFGKPATQFHHLIRSGEGSILADGDRGRVDSQDGSHEDDIVLSPDIATFTMLLNFMAKERDLPRAQEILERMRQLDLQPDAQFVAALIRLYTSVGDLITATSLAAHTCREVPGSRRWFHDLGLPVTDEGRHDLLSQPVSPSIHVFNALLPGLQEKFGLKGASIIRRIMRMAGVQPDAFTVERIMVHLSKVEQVRPRELIRVLRTLSDTFVPSLRHVHLILSSVVRSETELVKTRGWKHKRDIKKALSGRLSTVSDSFDPFAGIELPRKLSYRALIRPVLKVLSKQRVRSDKATVALRIRHDGVVKGNIDVAKETFQTLLDRGMHPNQYHFAAIMESFVKAGEIESAENVLKQAIADGITPNPVLYTILISGYASRGTPRHASRWFYDMIDRGVRPDIAVIDAMASAYFAVGAYTVARKVLLECWKHVGPLPDSTEDADLRQLATQFRAMASRHQWTGDLRHKDRRRLRGKLRQLLRTFVNKPRPDAHKRRSVRSTITDSDLAVKLGMLIMCCIE
ncbi:hypothetical protein QCA50_002067 [Cerrena zonata]|uniref:Pentatricopeptide repeat-containing protein n=1 Tax=Cerrena zonata TaxID=2478898 RepID=A0AAW0GUS0_9APHY